MNLLVFDVGASWTRLGRSDGRRLASLRIMPTPRHWRNAKKLFAPMAGQLFAGRKIQRVIGGLPGVLDVRHDRLIEARNLSGWAGQPIQRDLTYIFRAPVRLENDALLNGLGESHFGAGRGYSLVGFLTVSTGVNGARIVDGRVDRNSFGFELHHLLVPRRSGVTLGRTVSGHWLARHLGDPAVALARPRLRAAVTDAIALSVVNLMITWSPEVMVLGGSILRSVSFRALRSIAKRHWSLAAPMPPIVPGTLGDRSGLLGAISLARVTPGRPVR